jgi:uncharacterized MnhB-related membrane protein
MLTTCLAIAAIICAFQAIRVTRLLASALWLAGLSALVSIIFYVMGAQQVAVIELSVGAGLVTVLFVFAIGIAGEDALDARSLLPKPLALGLVVLTALLLGWMTLPVTGVGSPVSEPPFAAVLWQQRGLDVLVQVVLIFAGTLGVLGLLAEVPVSEEARMEELAALETAFPEHDEAPQMPEPTPEGMPV